jgi:hypothetical protein
MAERLRIGNVFDEEYLEDYPNAEVNPDRAKEMALASTSPETVAAHARALGKMAEALDGPGMREYTNERRSWMSHGLQQYADRGYGTQPDAAYQLKRTAEINEAHARMLADEAGRLYDIKQGYANR